MVPYQQTFFFSDFETLEKSIEKNLEKTVEKNPQNAPIIFSARWLNKSLYRVLWLIARGRRIFLKSF